MLYSASRARTVVLGAVTALDARYAADVIRGLELPPGRAPRHDISDAPRLTAALREALTGAPEYHQVYDPRTVEPATTEEVAP